MAEIGYATLGIIPSFDGFGRKLDSGTSRAMLTAGTSGGNTFGDAAGKSAGSRFGSVFKNAAKAGLVGIGALGVGAFALAKDSISAASDLEESTNKVNQVFGKGADAVFRFSEKAADSLGQTNQQARDAAATFGLFGNIAGKTGKQSANFATRMTTLASDLASFHNTEPDQAVEALGAALRGEAEPMRAYGVLLDETVLKVEAMRLGLLKPVKDQTKITSYTLAVTEGQRAYNEAVKEFGKSSFEAEKAAASLGSKKDLLQKATEGTIPPLTQEQKVLAASSAIFRQTEVAQGDFARTSDGLANQQRRLKARFEDAKAELGTGLLPIMTDAADFLLDKGIPAFEDFSGWFNSKGIPAIKDFYEQAKPAGRAVRDLVGFFDDLPGAAKLAPITGLLGGLGLMKLRSGKGALGAAGSALGITKPIPVLVTNKGFGVGTGGGGGAVVTGADGKPTKTTSPRRGTGLGATIAAISLPWIVDELEAEASFARNRVRQGTFTPSTTELPSDKQVGGLADLLLSPLPGNPAKPGSLADLLRDPMLPGKLDNAKDHARSFGDVWGTTSGKVDRSAKVVKSSVDGVDASMRRLPRRVESQIIVSGAERARSQVESVADALEDLAGAASRGIDAAGQTVVDAVTGGGRGGRRRRNLGGMH